ncbi:hypothetical protein [Actinomyces procaprae]|uniref:hypothetical protein n=1 Tax=Actinomyces procaprae TaxID=2560010 RepID=UPI00109DE3FA|nr:hypothetical protein [Actinomyces procaprae]
MTAATSNAPSSQDGYALKYLNLRTPLASYADPSSVPIGSTPFGQPPGGGSTLFGAPAPGGDQDDMVCTRGDWAPGVQPSTGSGPYTTDAALPYPLTWPGMPAGTGVTVSGGTYGVNTNDLTRFAATLDTAADWLEDARDLALTCLTDLRCGGLGIDMVSQWNIGADGSLRIGFDTTHDAMTSGGGRCVSWLADTSDTAAERATAIAALEALTSGSGSLDDAADSLRTLATAVTLCTTTYTDAESESDGAWLRILQVARVGAMLGMGGAGAMTLLTGIVAMLSVDGAALPDGMDDVLQNLEMLLGDQILDDWAHTDIMIVLGLAVWAMQANSGLESTTIETYLGQVAEELDPAVSEVLPAQVQVGSRMVDTDSLTPMQRVAYYLAICAEQSGASRYGEPTGVTVTPHGGQPVTVPTGVRDPFGFGTAVPAVAAALPPSGTAGPQPGTAAEVIRYSSDMKGRDDDASSGVVSILRTDHADGTTSWLVVVPGTTDWGSGNTNPQDLLTNLQAVSGRPTDMETAVVTAMREAGIAPGDKVGLYGHSQGAITASNIAADPAVNEQFNITNLLTAGGPTAGADLPENVNALHLENTGDAVPALDAAPTPRTPTRTVVTIDTHSANVDGYPHGPQVYADAVDGICGNPQIDQWTEELGGITGAGEDGAETTEIIFDITRDSPDTVWEQAGRDFGKQG